MAFMPAAALGLSAADATLGAAGISAGASVLGGIMGASGQAATNAQSLQEMYAQQAYGMNMQTNVMNYETQMSNTAYQRAMADMKAAGLNPILAANLGGASTPNLGIPSTSAPALGNPGAFMQQGVTQAGQALTQIPAMKAQLAQADKDLAGSKLNDAQTRYHDANTNILNTVMRDKYVQDTATSAAQARNADAQAGAAGASAAYDYARTKIALEDANTARSQARLKQLEADAAGKYGPGEVGVLATNAERILGGAWKAFKQYQGENAATAVGGAAGGGLVKGNNPNTTFTLPKGGGYYRD